MKRILSFTYSLLISVLITSLAFGGGIPIHFFGPPMPPTDTSRVLNIDFSRNQTTDLASRTALTQTYAGLNRTYVDAFGNLQTAPANTPIIEYVNGKPYLRIEPAGMNLLFNPRFTTNGAGFTATATMANAGAIGADGVAGKGLLVTDNSAIFWQDMYRSISKSASDSTTYFRSTVWVRKVTTTTCYPALGVYFGGGTDKSAFFVINHIAGTLTARDVNDAANIGSRITPSGAGWQVDVWATDNGTNTSAHWYFAPAFNADASATEAGAAQGSVTIDYGKLSTGAIPSSLFDGAPAIGNELVTNGSFAAVDEVEAVAGVTVKGNCYKILERTDIDYTADGAPNNNVGTYFNSTVGGATIDGAGGNDRLNNVTLTNWMIAGAGTAAPQAVAGSLTGKALIKGNPLFQPSPALSITAGKVYRVTLDATRTAGIIGVVYVGGRSAGAVTATSSAVLYGISTTTGNLIFSSSGDCDFVIDNVSVKEHGTVRISEANTVTLAMPAAVAAALADTGTLVWKGMFGYARAAGVVTNIVAATAATDSLLYTTTAAGNLSSYDGTNIAASTAAYTALTSTKLALQWPSSANKFKIGADVAGGGIAYAAEANFDGAFTVGPNLIFCFTVHGPTYFEKVGIYNKLLSDAQVNAF
ncbi:MAG TPA: hypothetical protein DDY86_04715 [Syntrophaceae bacterium]|nr:hypothetical protein [Syntrophaceae bacterium]